MNLDQAKILANQLMHKFGLLVRDWTFKVDYQTKNRRLGQCRYGSKEIGLSAWYIETAEDSVVEDTIRHEIAHALANIEFGCMGHGPEWKAMCKRTGACPSRMKLSQSIPARERYKATCNKCGKVFKRHVGPRPGTSYYCKQCPPGSTLPLRWENVKHEFAREAADRAKSRVSDVLINHIDEVEKLMIQLGSCNDKNQAKRIRARLRKLGHRGGLS
jgi:predicted SprT family Zn-dependent metalloprotease